MPLFWIASEIDGERLFYIREDTAQIFAMLRWRGERKATYLESGQIDPAMEKKVPKKMIGRDLSQEDVQALLKRLDGK